MAASWDVISTQVKVAALAGLNRGASLVEERAKAHAPVRRIFEGGSRTVRFKSMAEVKADREIRRRVGLGREYVAAPRTRLRSRRGMGKAKVSTVTSTNANVPVFRVRGTSGLAVPVATMRLSRQGRYEVASGRADHNGLVGGRLRDEITAVGASGEGSFFTARVISPTPYAKYQEFGTQHNAAHPFLRPALRESRAEVVAGMRSAIRAAIRESKTTARVELE